MRPHLCAFAVLALGISAFEPATLQDLIKSAEQALKDGKTEQALKFANEAVKGNAKSADAYFLRGSIFESTRKHEEALKDFDKTIALDPRGADAYNHRGSEHLKQGKFDLAVKDFDKFLELRPDQGPGHWRRGIACYYAGKFELGRKQFEAYESVDKNDVENLVWRYLCAARESGVDKAREVLRTKTPKDARVPFTEIYALYAGTRGSDPLAVANSDVGNPTPEQKTERLFYAHLYVGLYHDAAGNKKLALEHTRKAADDYKIGHYMWDVAVVHRDVLHKELKP